MKNIKELNARDYVDAIRIMQEEGSYTLYVNGGDFLEVYPYRDKYRRGIIGATKLDPAWRIIKVSRKEFDRYVDKLNARGYTQVYAGKQVNR